MSSSVGPLGPLVAAIDQGTSSTRVFIFASNTAEMVTQEQIELGSIYPHEGWVEQDPMAILDTVHKSIASVVENLKDLDINPSDIKAIGISNQRETTIMWDKLTGKPLSNAIVWLDTRTASTVDNFINKEAEIEDLLPQSKERLQVRVLSGYLQQRCGLPLSTYFSAVKINWLMKNDYEVAKAIEEDRCLFGTVDSWLLWNLTGGVNGGIHCTDVTNASRTMLMNITTLKWDPDLCSFFDIPKSILPEIRSSSEIYGKVREGPFKGIPLSGCLGDQSAALVGQTCFQSGMAKNTYGTGCFMLYNTGSEVIFSKNGLLTTVAYQLGKGVPVCYALEGSVAIAGACIKWLKKMDLIESASETEQIANSVENTHGVYFVPAFSGLFAPYWESDARGIIIGLTHYTEKAHLVRAALESVCFQTGEILDAMGKDSKIPLKSLQVDGGMCSNNLLLQLQSDLIGIPVVRPAMLETSALGAAMAAGAAEGINVWNLESDHMAAAARTYLPQISELERQIRCEKWIKAVHRCMHWE